jgi:hypothetical protein
LRLWGPITLRADLRLRWSLKQSCILRRELFKGVFHATCMQGNRVDSRLLVVGSQTANLTLGISFGHKLHFRYPNGSCEPILDICVLKVFQGYKEHLKPLSFDPLNHLLKIWESIGTPSLKVGVASGVWGFVLSHFPTFLGTCGVIPGLPSWPTTLQALCLGCEPKARVVITSLLKLFIYLFIVFVSLLKLLVSLLLFSSCKSIYSTLI